MTYRICHDHTAALLVLHPGTGQQRRFLVRTQEDLNRAIRATLGTLLPEQREPCMQRLHAAYEAHLDAAADHLLTTIDLHDPEAP